MKKLYTTPEYTKWHKRKIERINRKLRKKKIGVKREKKTGKGKKRYSGQSQTIDLKDPVIAPEDLRLIENLHGCLEFFRDLRSLEYRSRKGLLNYVVMSLKNVEKIDYGTISVLTAINDDLKFKRVTLQSILPDNETCRNFMIEAGYLNNLYDSKGKRFPKAEKSELIFFEKGFGKLSVKDNIAISNTVKNVVKHLTGELNQCLSVKSIILEICGNSIEWGGTENRQWLLGVKYEPEKVVFTVTDVGKGILETLHRKFSLVLGDIFRMKTGAEILRGAFDQKYGSSTKEANRNKGLPAVKHNFEHEIIRNLKVLCNNVILHFDNESLSKTFEKGKPRFKGTYYQWEMTNECINNLTKN